MLEDILKGAGVLVAFGIIVYLSAIRNPKTRANGVPYVKNVGPTGPENDWESTIVK